MNVEIVRDVISLHSEEVFRGHLSNGCSICGPDNDEHYPCKTVRLLRKALEDEQENIHFGCPDCTEQGGCDCRWKGVL